MTLFSRLACCALLAATSVCAFAQNVPLRMFPPSVKFATLRVGPAFDATLNKDPVRLSPGLRLYTQQNMMVLPSTVVNQPVKVAYVLDIQGFVKEAWILSDNEIQSVEIKDKDKGFWSFLSNPFQ